MTLRVLVMTLRVLVMTLHVLVLSYSVLLGCVCSRGMRFENVNILTELIMDVIRGVRYCW